SVGFPYLLLAATGPLLQRWYARRDGVAFPYRLFAVSNAGSLAALMVYPFAIEPVISVRHQLFAWSVAYAAVVLLVGLAAFLSAANRAPEPAKSPSAPRADRLLWVALAACPSVLWLGVANELSQNVAPIPLLWILPLSIYLLSFILCFDRQGWYRPAVYRVALPAGWLLMGYCLSRQGSSLPLTWVMVALSAGLFACCMFCHGELASRKPHPEQLTSFYLMLALGGALGGLFVGLAAPLLFSRYLELPIGITACVVLAAGLLYGYPPRRLVRLAITAALGFVAATQISGYLAGDRLRIRNFYGALQVSDSGTGNMAVRMLGNGPINHGSQFLAPEKGRWATTYYGPDSGAGLAIGFQRQRPQRVGVIGLGAGTLASYGRAGDTYRFYEINPAVIALANTEFRYLRECPCTVSVVPGDGRLVLEREPGQNFDVLVVDAFNGDSIPVHLLTREAYAAYLKHLKQGGILAVHVTNRYLDLTPVVQGLAENHAMQSRLIRNTADAERGISGATWVLAATNPEFLASLSGTATPFPPARHLRLWTDDYSNLFQVLR
ncbi:MAG: fused MFS/spermidine synthase, partial [Candidatus Solibacter sp.]|nr:fused MFS/spermidine synthase [Candidatus Solibacter sp.]